MTTKELSTDHGQRTTDHGQLTTDHKQLDNHRYALNRGPGLWELTFEGRHATFEQEQGALYVA